MVEVDRRQVADLRLCEIYAHVVVDALDGADRYRDLSLCPQVAGFQEHMRDVTIYRIDRDPTNPADRSVRSLDLITAS
jgi:hypothetical protein